MTKELNSSPPEGARKAWQGVNAHVIARCKYCKQWAPVEVMIFDPESEKMYHPECQLKDGQPESDKNVVNLDEKT